MDPHKRSATIEVMATDETVLGGGRFATYAVGYREMVAYARQWPARSWAVEGSNGIGRHIAMRLVADGEQVVDVPSKLSARARVFISGQGRKTDAWDAHSVYQPLPNQGTLRLAERHRTAPIDASSGDQVRHRLSRAGNRQINRVLHIRAVVKLRNQTEGRAYFDRRIAEGKTPMEAMRALKRRLSDIVYKQMKDDAQRVGASPGGHPGTTLQSSVADSHPDIDTTDQSLPGPANHKPRTDLAALS